jgi:C-terminal processing protease CtpA/Prc
VLKLEVRHADGTLATMTLQRSVALDSAASSNEPRPEKLAEIRPGVFYLDVNRITDDDVKAAMERLANAKGVVIDFRGYPSRLSPILIAHLIDKPVTSAQWHIPQFTRPDRVGMTFDFSNWPVEPQAPRFQGKVAFLINGEAISYAETYMGIVEHYKLGALVGGPTAGTNGNVNPLTLPGGYRVAWTGMQVLKHDGSRHHGVGILPTVPVARTLAGVAAGRDEVLEKGIELVSQ